MNNNIYTGKEIIDYDCFNLQKSQLERMEAELTGARAMLSPAGGGGAREVESLREQLQVHIQTIGILVAEKSELQSSLTHTTHALNQKAGM